MLRAGASFVSAANVLSDWPSTLSATVYACMCDAVTQRSENATLLNEAKQVSTVLEPTECALKQAMAARVQASTPPVPKQCAGPSADPNLEPTPLPIACNSKAGCPTPAIFASGTPRPAGWLPWKTAVACQIASSSTQTLTWPVRCQKQSRSAKLKQELSEQMAKTVRQLHRTIADAVGIHAARILCFLLSAS